MAWQTITGPWGTHVANPTLADQWGAEASRRLALAQSLVSVPAMSAATTPQWTTQRDAIVAAWQAYAYAYQAANLPPPSDPAYRVIMRAWYGHCVTDSPSLEAGRSGPLVSLGDGRVSTVVQDAWRQLRNNPTAVVAFHATAVRLSLGSDGSVESMCLQATGPGDCDYRGLFTGCASLNAQGKYFEHDCNIFYDASTMSWMDNAAAGSRVSPPLRMSVDVLADLVTAWQSRGGAVPIIGIVRSWDMLTNAANAQLSNLLPENYLGATSTLVAQANAATSGPSPARTALLTGIAATTAACAAVAGIYAPICGVVGGVAALAVNVMPLATGVGVDALGMPILHGNESAAYLPAMIAPPNALGQISLNVPPVPVPGLGMLPIVPLQLSYSNPKAAPYGYAQQNVTTGGGLYTPPVSGGTAANLWAGLAVAAGLVFALGGKRGARL